jgi:carbonic anhydrase
MQKLVEGIHEFQKSVFCARQQMFEKLAKGQKPLALFITCSDSRIDPAMLTQTEPGELFILRNAGNIVPPHGATNGGEAATIEYAVAALHVKDIIICGHSHCGAMAGLLHPEILQDLSSVSAWLQHAEATRRIIKENYTHITEERARVTATVEENVLVQLENLRTHPAVAAALAREELHLHGWVYQFECGKVHCYDPEQGQFVGLEESFRSAVVTPQTPSI